MLDIGWQELFIVAVLALIVVGPKDLPRALRAVMKAIRKVRAMAGEFQSGLDEVAREADLDDLRREANKMTSFDPTDEIKKNLDPDGEIEKAADIDKDVRDAMTDAKTTAKANTASSEAPVQETKVETPGNSLGPNFERGPTSAELAAAEEAKKAETPEKA